GILRRHDLAGRCRCHREHRELRIAHLAGPAHSAPLCRGRTMNIFASVGRLFLLFLAEVGRLTRFTVSAVSSIVRPPVYWRLLLQQIMRIGWFSLPVVGLTAFFTGGALALQIFIGGNRYGAEAIVPQIVVLGITRELGPVIAGLMFAGRVAAAIAAEIGTMRVTE